MKLEITISVIIHLVALAMAVMASPFGQSQSLPPGEVIQVQLLSESDLAGNQAPAIVEQPITEPLDIPSAVEEEPVEVPLEEPATVEEEAVIDDEPEPIPDDATQPREEPPAEEPSTRPSTGTETSAPAETGSEIHVPSTAGGSPLAGASVDNASFQYPYWFTQAFNKILRNFRNPVAADGAIVAVVSFRVIKSGRVIDVEVVESSGIARFDEACIRAVESSSPFPPLPRRFTDEVIGITLPFKYEPR